MKPSSWRLAAGCAVATTSLFVLPVAALAEEGLDVVNDTSYYVDGQTGVVRVAATLRIENTTPDERVSGGVRYFYYTGYSLPVPSGAMNVSVTTAAGDPLAFTTELSEDSSFSWIEIEFAQDLRFGKVLDLSVNFDMVGGAPRSDDFARINGAVSSFPVFGYGDPGKATVRVVIPVGLETELLGDEMVASTAPGVDVYTAEAIENPDDWYAFITTRNDANLVVTDLQVGDASFEIRSWPGDDQWTQFMSSIVTSGLPTLEELTGQPWPHSNAFQLTESLSPYLYGYAGWYDGAAEQIEVGEELDDEVMLHELSHAWFNSDAFTERWLNEGLADAFAVAAMKKLGKTPSEEPDVSVGDPGAVRLADWGEPFGTDEEIEELEDFGYAASRLVMTRIFKEVGEEKMRLVLDAAFDGTIPYVGEGEPESLDEFAHNWRRFLDLTEELGGSTVTESLLREWVLRDDQLVLLDERNEARTAYDALEIADGEWAMPAGIRRSMTSWNFTTATDRMEDAQVVVDAYADLETVIAPLDVEITDEVEMAYEAATNNQDEALAVIEEFKVAGEKLLASEAEIAAERGFFEKIGLRGETPQVDQDAALAKFSKGDTAGAIASAERVNEVFADAESLGKRRAMTVGGGALGALVLITLTGVVFRRRRKRRNARIEAAAHADLLAESASDPAEALVLAGFAPPTGPQFVAPSDQVAWPAPNDSPEQP